MTFGIFPSFPIAELGKSAFIHRSTMRLKLMLTEDEGQQTANFQYSHDTLQLTLLHSSLSCSIRVA